MVTPAILEEEEIDLEKVLFGESEEVQAEAGTETKDLSLKKDTAANESDAADDDTGDSNADDSSNNNEEERTSVQ